MCAYNDEKEQLCNGEMSHTQLLSVSEFSIIANITCVVNKQQDKKLMPIT